MDPIRPSGPNAPRPIQPKDDTDKPKSAGSLGEHLRSPETRAEGPASASLSEFRVQTEEISRLRDQGLGPEEIRRAVIERHLTDFLGDQPDPDMIASIEARVTEDPNLSAMFSRLLAGANRSPNA